MKKAKKSKPTGKDKKVRMLDNLRYWTFGILIIAVVMFILSIFLPTAISSTAFLLGGIILFIIWVLVYFTLDEKARRLKK